MTDFKTIFGRKIKLQTSDLTMSAATEGELFYSDTDKEFKVGVTVKSWASGGNLGTGRYGGGFGQNQNSAALAGMDGLGSPPYRTAATEEYDGSSWTAGGNLGTSRYRLCATGTQTAGMGTGGYIPGSGLQSLNEEYNGSAWSEVTNFPTGVQFGNQAGPQTAAILATYNNPGGDAAEAFTYDGSSWTASGNMNTARRQGGFCGDTAAQTAGLVTGGYNPPGSPNGDTDTVESWDGSSWTAETGMTNKRHAMGCQGISTNALVFGGSTDNFRLTENWDGSSWTASSAKTTNIRAVHNGGGTTDAALAIGGNPAGNATEEFSSAVTLKTVTDS